MIVTDIIQCKQYSAETAGVGRKNEAHIFIFCHKTSKMKQNQIIIMQ
jgi:hypothetical protein